jgi:hypothetical protein
MGRALQPTPTGQREHTIKQSIASIKQTRLMIGTISGVAVQRWRTTPEAQL